MISPIKVTVDIMWFDVVLSVTNDLEPLPTPGVGLAAPPPQKALSWVAFWSCLSQERKINHVCMEALLNSIILFFLTLFANWYVTRINAKITCKTGYPLFFAKNVSLKTCGDLPHQPWLTGRHWVQCIDDQLVRCCDWNLNALRRDVRRVSLSLIHLFLSESH